MYILLLFWKLIQISLKSNMPTNLVYELDIRWLLTVKTIKLAKIKGLYQTNRNNVIILKYQFSLFGALGSFGCSWIC